MTLTPAEARTWLDGFEAAEMAGREATRREGPRHERSVALALSLFAVARQAAGGRLPLDPRRAEQEEETRLTWERLRSRLLP